MTELAVFTEAIAEELMARGFELVGKSKYAWFFEDSVELERELGLLVEDYGLIE